MKLRMPRMHADLPALLLCLAMALLPLLVLAGFALGGETSTGLGEIAAGLRASLWLAVPAATLATLLASAAALTGSRPRLQLAVLALPVVLSPVLIGLGLARLVALLGEGAAWPSLLLAHAALALPFAWLPVRAALQEVRPGQRRALAGLGATPFARFRYLTLPSLLPGALTGWLLAFALSLAEPVVSSQLARLDDPPLTVLLLRHSDSIAGLPVLAAALALALPMALALWLLARGRQRKEAA